jgi:acyl-CoA synthetase (AMP-forming)/AMP-acid ligase II
LARVGHRTVVSPPTRSRGYLECDRGGELTTSQENLRVEFNFSAIHEAIAAAAPENEAIVWRDRRITHAQLADRSRRLANYLLERGLTLHKERSELAGHESGQDHVALYLYNGNEYIEGMLGAWRARLASLNVNYRYVEEELCYLFENSQAKAIIYHSEFADRVAAIRDQCPNLEVLIQVADESGAPLLPGAVDYEEALASASAELPQLAHSSDDLYILYTGGTTGMPKGVLWRSHDIFMAAMGGRKMDGSVFGSVEEIAENVKRAGGMKTLVGPPLMHGAAQWASFIMMTSGATIVLPNVVDRMDADDFPSPVERERCVSFSIVGDAFARPLLDLGSGGAPLSTTNKEEFLRHIPNATVIDSIGSSETGAQGSNAAAKGGGISTGDFKPAEGSCVVSEDLTRLLLPSEANELGWFAQTGFMPLGYFRDADKTARTFPTIDGIRYSVPGDRARYREDGSIEVVGRDSVTINSGGEKIFAEEVEAAIKHHPDVYDAVVAGRPSDRWGQEVVAVVCLRDGSSVDAGGLIEEAEKHIARYKLPKAVVFRDEIQRSPSGKADYRWAKEQAEQG